MNAVPEFRIETITAFTGEDVVFILIDGNDIFDQSPFGNFQLSTKKRRINDSFLSVQDLNDLKLSAAEFIHVAYPYSLIIDTIISVSAETVVF